MKVDKVKQVLVMRKDLKCRRGKELVQMTHASMSFLTKPMRGTTDNEQTVVLSDDALEWINDGFTKIGLCVNSEKELTELYQMALIKGLEAHLIIDKGLTEFNGVPTKTAIAIGPNKASEIDVITGGLKLY